MTAPIPPTVVLEAQPHGSAVRREHHRDRLRLRMLAHVGERRLGDAQQRDLDRRGQRRQIRIDLQPADDSGPDEWLAATRRFTHVYQRAADTREPAFVARAE